MKYMEILELSMMCNQIIKPCVLFRISFGTVQLINSTYGKLISDHTEKLAMEFTLVIIKLVSLFLIEVCDVV